MQAVTVIGAGYVGFPLAVQIAKSKKFTTFIYDIDTEKIKKINQFQSPISNSNTHHFLKSIPLKATNKPGDCLPYSDFVIICVPTSIYKNDKPNLRSVYKVCRVITKYLKRGQTIILESTVSPKTCDKYLIPIFHESGLKVGKDFNFSHCPERINPGDKKWQVANIPRIIGSYNQSGLKITLNFYKKVLQAPLYPVENLLEAECTKLVENTFRDINIAYVNELAMLFDRLGVNTLNILKAATTKPFSFIPHYPGCGVGGECIATDPYYLINTAKYLKINLKLISQARKTNRFMPSYIIELLKQALKLQKFKRDQIMVVVLGLSYKENVADIRHSPALVLAKNLRAAGFRFIKYDPLVPELSDKNTIQAVLKICQVVIICTKHQNIIEYLNSVEYKKFKTKIIIDGRNCLDFLKLKRQNIYYKGIGI